MILPENLNKINKEFIGIDGELYRVKIELVHFNEFESSTLYKLQELLDADLIAQVSLDTINIKGEKPRLQKFGLCRFGGFDDKADITKTCENHEYYDCGLLMFLWLAVLQQRDYVYRRTAMPGTPCRYWDGEERFEGRIVKLESGVATIKDFLTGDIFYRNFKETEAL